MTRWIAAIALLAAGCVSAPRPAPVVAESRIEPPAPVEKAKEPVSPQPEPIAPPVAQAPAPPPPAAPAPAPSPPSAEKPAAVAAPLHAAPKPPPAAAAPKPAPKAIPAPVPPKAPPPTPAAKAPAAQPAAAAPLDLKTLEERLKETEAIGLMTKLSLKNQVDDLVDEFRAYYAGRSKASLGELRRPYEMLLMKVLTLLQDRDPPLARAVNASRDQIWSILSDREKFFSTLS
jgi:outer membrane biosynthesis protein TonB